MGTRGIREPAPAPPTPRGATSLFRACPISSPGLVMFQAASCKPGAFLHAKSVP